MDAFSAAVFISHFDHGLYKYGRFIYRFLMSTTTRMQSPSFFIVSNAEFIPPSLLRWVMNSSTMRPPLR